MIIIEEKFPLKVQLDSSAFNIEENSLPVDFSEFNKPFNLKMSRSNSS